MAHMYCAHTSLGYIYEYVIVCLKSMKCTGLYRMYTHMWGQNSSVGSAWDRCPQCRGFDPPLGIFPLELTWVQTPFPQKLLRMRV